MARRGRPSKAGKRTKGGRLKVPYDPQIVQPSDRARVRRDLYRQDGWDAIGRAYVMGLMGEGEEAKSRLDTGRRLAAIYRQTYARGYRSALDDTPRGSVNAMERDDALERQERMTADLALIAATGFRPYFDQLVLDDSPDDGPAWLDRLIEAVLYNRVRVACGMASLPLAGNDWFTLRAALKALDAIVPKTSRGGIVTTLAA